MIDTRQTRPLGESEHAAEERDASTYGGPKRGDSRYGTESAGGNAQKTHDARQFQNACGEEDETQDHHEETRQAYDEEARN